MKIETAEIPFITMDNHQVLTDRQLRDEPYLADFVERFPRCFERDDIRNIWIFYPGGKPE
jgi:hypothetical protein